MTAPAPAPWVVLAVPPLPPYVVWADPPRSALPAPGEHLVDPRRSTVTLSVRRWGRWLRFTSPVAGRMRAERSSELAVDLTVDLADLAAGTGPGLWIAAAQPTAINGVWVLQGSAEICGFRRPLNLWLDPVERRPDGQTRLTATGWFDGRDVGLPAPVAARRVRIDLSLVTY
jgi:hypothetical protein